MAIVSTELEVQDITTLPKRTASGIDPDTDFVLGVEENGIAYKADIEDLGQSIIQGAKSNLIGRNQTVASALSMLREETNEKIKESYGAPLVANQASDMKDKTRVYVYTGHESGYHHHGWYYWNNVAWTLGDEYNAGIVTTDATLTLADMPADAKAVGDALDEVNAELSSITDDIEQLQEDSSGYVASTSIAPEYSSSGIYAVGDYCTHDGVLYRCTTAISTAEAWNASYWAADNVKNIADGLKGDVSDLKDDLSNIEASIGTVNMFDSDTCTMVARFSNYVTFTDNNLIFAQNSSGTNKVIVYVPIEENTSYDFLIENYASAESYGWKFADEVSSEWNVGGFTFNVPSGTVNNSSYGYLCFLVAGASNYSGTVSLTVNEHMGSTILSEINSLNREVTNIDSDISQLNQEIDAVASSIERMSQGLTDTGNIFSANTCTLMARFPDYVVLNGHEIVFSTNTLGSNYANVYVPLEFGASYVLDLSDASSLQRCGIKFSNAIADATNQGFDTPVSSFLNDGANNKYLVILFQATSDYSGSITAEVRKDISQNLKARIGSGYAYSSILRAMKETSDDVELMLVDNVYDLMQEYTEYYGSDFWENYSGYQGKTDRFLSGLYLTGNRSIRGIGNPIIKMQYDGANTNVGLEFSVFGFAPYLSTVSISNLTILYRGVRYAIHDDFNPQYAKIIMDSLIIDGIPYSTGAIGAGLGINTEHIIKNCLFLNNTKINDISYHGNTTPSTNSKSRIVVSNCYGTKACVFRWYGASTEITDCIVNNSKFGSIQCIAYDENQPNVNMRLIEYLNEVA